MGAQRLIYERSWNMGGMPMLLFVASFDAQGGDAPGGDLDGVRELLTFLFEAVALIDRLGRGAFPLERDLGRFSAAGEEAEDVAFAVVGWFERGDGDVVRLQV